MVRKSALRQRFALLSFALLPQLDVKDTGTATTNAAQYIVLHFHHIVCSYIISQSDVRCLGVQVEVMMGVCDPTVLNGESGYYLTVLGAALSVRVKCWPREQNLLAPSVVPRG